MCCKMMEGFSPGGMLFGLLLGFRSFIRPQEAITTEVLALPWRNHDCFKENAHHLARPRDRSRPDRRRHKYPDRSVHRPESQISKGLRSAVEDSLHPAHAWSWRPHLRRSACGHQTRLNRGSDL